MKPKHFLFILFAAALFSFVSCTNTSKTTEEKKQPNIVIIFLDDSGYSDFTPFGQTKVKTPHVQKLAEEGITFTNFYVPQAICSASRSALISGCYPGRTKVLGLMAPMKEAWKPVSRLSPRFLKRPVTVQPFLASGTVAISLKPARPAAVLMKAAG